MQSPDSTGHSFAYYGTCAIGNMHTSAMRGLAAHRGHQIFSEVTELLHECVFEVKVKLLLSLTTLCLYWYY